MVVSPRDDLMRFDLVDNFKIPRSTRSVVFVGREQVEIGAKHFFLINNIYPYFGVPYGEELHIEHDNAVMHIEYTTDITGQHKVAKIHVNGTDDVVRLRDEFTTTYESNILYHERVKIDMGIKSGFEIPDAKIRGKCFGCKGIEYHHIHSDDFVEVW